MKKSVKDSQSDILSQRKLARKRDLIGTSADNSENKNSSYLNRLLTALNRLLTAYSQFYDRNKLKLFILWIFVILFFIISHLGALTIARSLSTPQELPTPQEHSEIIFDEPRARLISVSQPLDRSNIERNKIQINTELLNTLDYAYRKAEFRATKELDNYIDRLMFRVDDDFLNWYFNWFNKKWREDSALITWILGKDVKESQGKTFIQEFSKRVVSKTEAEQTIQQIVDDAAETYVSVLKYKLERIGFKYNIPETQWNGYLDNITFNIPGTGNANLAEITVVGVYPLVKAIAIPSLTKISILGAEKITAIAGAKYAAKLGIEAASETAIGTLAKVANPLVLVGFVFWEVSDYQATLGEQKPALHDSIFETFKEIEDDILYDRSSGIMTTLHYIENSIRNSIILRSTSQRNVSIPTIQS